MKRLTLIAGPCVIEDMQCLETVATEMIRITKKLDINYYFKASFDKANRTSLTGFRGPGLKTGLEMLSELKKKYNVPIATDIHEPWQAALVSEVADIIQIPAFLCRQTDLLVAAATTNKIINVKKAQFLAPWDMAHVITKIKESGNNRILLCERGTCFGYNNLVVDMTNIVEMKKYGYPIVFDATHSVQKPGGNGSSTGGNRNYVEPLARAAVAIGVDHLFMEVHPQPDKALSDGPNMVELSKMESLLERLVQIYSLVNKW